jgi:hypothetical protein
MRDGVERNSHQERPVERREGGRRIRESSRFEGLGWWIGNCRGSSSGGSHASWTKVRTTAFGTKARARHQEKKKEKKSSKDSKIKDGSQAIRKALKVKFESETKKEIKRGNNRSGRDHMQIARPAAAVVEVGSRLDSQQGHVVPQG